MSFIKQKIMNNKIRFQPYEINYNENHQVECDLC